MKQFLVILSVSCLLGIVWGFPSGAPSTACGTMLPRHGSRTRPQDHSRNPPPYVITIDGNPDTYTSGQKFEVYVESTDQVSDLAGFILEARPLTGNIRELVGSFVQTHQGTKTICDETALTHSLSRRGNKHRYHATWLAPDTDKGQIAFVATVVQSYTVFWTNIRSSVISPTKPTTPAPVAEKTSTSFLANTSLCEPTTLTPLPVERPHVAILCDQNENCPCGWICCPSCAENVCTGHAICRQKMQQSGKTESETGSFNEELLAEGSVNRPGRRQLREGRDRNSQEYAVSNRHRT